MIEVHGIVKGYPLPDGSGTHLAVDHVSLSIEAGEIFGVLGPNGAGKTSTLEMLEGLREIDEGSAHIGGIDVVKDSVAVKAIIGVQLQSSEYFDNLNLVELLALFIGLYGADMQPAELLALVDLTEKAKARPEHLSGGQRQRFTIACALANNPKVLFLDEPTTGLDPVAKRKLLATCSAAEW
ncbi:MAG: ABC transporter ATP-binding protein [Gammaproteobacteria bacterium]|nr:ABC transporter ATP-binding protein [Gammaproteobacteria bacterium]